VSRFDVEFILGLSDSEIEQGERVLITPGAAFVPVAAAIASLLKEPSIERIRTLDDALCALYDALDPPWEDTPPEGALAALVDLHNQVVAPSRDELIEETGQHLGTLEERLAELDPEFWEREVEWRWTRGLTAMAERLERAVTRA
jgi:hypothetical protein